MGNEERGLVGAGSEDRLCVGSSRVLGEGWSHERGGVSGKLQD